MMYFRSDSQRVSHSLNTLALWAVSGVLFMALAWQIVFNEIPCPLCLLQRVAFVLVGIGILLNVRFGSSSMHYGLIVLSALGGAFASGRQLLLHIAPGDHGYGSPFLGLHFYTWAFIVFATLIVWTAFMLLMDRHHADSGQKRHLGKFALFGVGVFFILVAANLVSTLLACGFGACPDDPVSYLWWP
jgi:disulfide bond formation protein DsbB